MSTTDLSQSTCTIVNGKWTVKRAHDTHLECQQIRDQIKALSEEFLQLHAEVGGAQELDPDVSIAKDQRKLRDLGNRIADLEQKLRAKDPVLRILDERKAKVKESKEAAKERGARELAEKREARDRTAKEDANLAYQTIQHSTFELAETAYDVYMNCLNNNDDHDAHAATLTKLIEQVMSHKVNISYCGDRSDEAMALIKAHATTIKQYRSTILDKEKVYTNIDDWEALLGQSDSDPIVLPNAEAQKQLLAGISVSYPFLNDKPAFEQVSGHPTCNASRIVGSTLLYFKGAKVIREQAQRDLENKRYTHTRPPVLFDIGAGSFGAERLATLRHVGVNKLVAIHATIPVVQEADVARDAATRRHEQFAGWNYLPETRTPSLRTLNYCRHVASECDCMKYYDPVNKYVVSIHAAYYFEQKDWRAIFKHCNQVETLMHLPKVGETVPLRNPEYVWEDGEHSDQQGLLGRIGCKIKRYLTGDRTVHLKPMRCGATHYVHRDVSQIITRGGFHFTSGDWVEDYCQGNLKTAGAVAAVALAGAVGGLAGAATASGPVIAACVLKGAAQAVLTTAAYAKFEATRSRMQRPLMAQSSVTAHVTSTQGEVGQEEISAIVRFKHGPPISLTPGITENVIVDGRNVGRVAAGLTLAKDKLVGMRQMAASLLRDDVPIRAVRDTIAHASRISSYVLPNGLCAPNGARLFRWAVVLPLSVLVPAGLASSTPAAGFLSPGVVMAAAAVYSLLMPCITLTLPLWFLLSSSV